MKTSNVWDYRHKAPGGPADNQGGGMATNTMPDLAFTMKSNPKMRVMLAGISICPRRF
jgi:hypothetical protein